ncbi:MAG: alpha/beta hydrolase [Actinomycetota bacterium]
MLIIAGTVLAIAYCGACLYLFLEQKKFIFFPARAVEMTPDAFGLRYQDVWLPVSAKTGQVERIHGWWIPADRSFSGSAPAELAPVVLYLHGNGSNVGANVEHANRFHRLGLSVLLIDYRGYGRSTGDFPTEAQVYEDAEVAWNSLVQERGIQPGRIFLYGHSLGGAIAIELAVRHPEAGGLIVEGSFISARAMVDYRGQYWMFPVDLLLNQRFDSIAKVPHLKLPVLFIHGTSDRVVPVEMSHQLFEASPEPKQLYIVPGADHTDLAQVAGADYLQKLHNFFHKYESKL